MTRVAVFGAGAVGSYLGSRFAAAGADVHLVARGAILEALRTNGLTIVSPDGTSTTEQVQATDDAASIGPVDFVVFGVKSYDTEAAAPRLLPLLGPETAVLSFQNGIDNEAKIAAAVGDNRVIGAAIYILSAMQAPGIVRSGPGRLVVGELRPGPPSERVLRLVDLAKAGGVGASAVDDVRIAKWEKYVLLVGFSAVTAATQLTVGDVRRSPAASAMLRAVMHEAWSVGKRLGVPLTDDLVDRQHALVLAQADDEGTSLRHDLRTGRRMELDALQGTLSRLGRETGVPTPWTDAAYAVLEPWAIRNARGAAGG
jgi:2-dehydropantoate 2-reductase